MNRVVAPLVACIAVVAILLGVAAPAEARPVRHRASVACPQLAHHSGAQAWFNVRHAPTSRVADKMGRVICSAAPHSTILVASMFIWGGNRTVGTLVNDLRYVAAERHVHVRVLVDRTQFPAHGSHGRWTWRQFSRAFRFADIQSCVHACTVAGGQAMHMKFLTVSRTVWGGPVVVESTLNWSPQQFNRQNGSAVYFPDRPVLYRAYAARWARAAAHTPADAATLGRGWADVGHGVAYAFDPSAMSADPISAELASLTCQPGDSISVVNANVTRGTMVDQLNRLHSAGCAVRVISERYFVAQAATFGPQRHMTTHDKFVLIHAHTARGPVGEVISGSEDYRPSSMLVAEEQLVRVRTVGVVGSFTRWFDRDWREAA